MEFSFLRALRYHIMVKHGKGEGEVKNICNSLLTLLKHTFPVHMVLCGTQGELIT
jgi:hypothetical protein